MSAFRNILLMTAMINLAACDGGDKGPKIVSYAPTHGVVLAEDNSMLGSLCTGQDFATHSIILRGHTRYIARVSLESISDGGIPAPDGVMTAPADEGISQMVNAEFHSGANCSGWGLRTVVVQQDGDNYLQWRLEFGSGKGPASIHGHTLIHNENGEGADTIAFLVDSKKYIAHLTVSPGPVFVAEKRAEEARLDAEKNRYPSVATPLPDEHPYRTLEDDTSPSYR